jgi:hypothetical protein
MGESVRVFSGREFSADDISLIKETVKMYPKLSQKELASTVCELIGWLSPGGRTKRIQCINFLRQLEVEGIITLPAVRVEKVSSKRVDIEATDRIIIAGAADQEVVTSCGEIKLEIVRPGVRLAVWREYVRKHHILGDPNVTGSQLRYMITSEGRDLGCFLFSASSWALAPREKWIGWTAEEKTSRLHLIVNNSRFLLLPWIQIRYLASRALSMVARRIQKDWLDEYCYAPVLLETFVEPPFKGTAYKASNWIYLGDTQGRGRNDRYGERLLTRKAIYVMPLQRNFRAILRGEKPCKAVNPDDY